MQNYTVLESVICPLTDIKAYLDYMSKPHSISFDGKEVGMITGVREWTPYPELPHHYKVRVNAIMTDEFMNLMRDQYSHTHCSFEIEEVDDNV